MLSLDVHGLVVIFGIDDHGEVQSLRVCPAEARVAVGRPLHGSSHSVAIAQVDVVAHADLVAVVDHGCSREREQKGIHQLDAAAVVAEQGGKPVANAQVDSRVQVAGVSPVHVVALLIGDHFEGELVVISQEETPLAALGDLRRLGHDVVDRKPIFLMKRHEQPRHEREVEDHVAFVPLAEVGDGILGPLVRLGQEHPSREAGIDVRARAFRN